MKSDLPILELSGYLVPPGEFFLEPFDFSASAMDFWALNTDLPEKAHLFFQALARLTAPLRGTYFLTGQQLDFNDYKCLLACKKKISYVSPTISLVSNRTIRENLLMTECYEHNALYLPLTPAIEKMCRQFDLTHKLDRRATEANQWDLRTSLAIRELTKNASILLIDRPEEMVPPEKRSLLLSLLKDRAASGRPVIFYSRNKKYIDNFAPTGRIDISKGKVTITARPFEKS